MKYKGFQMVKELQYDTIFDAQRHFRILLDCMARPGKIDKLDGVEVGNPIGLYKASALTGFALLDAEVTFWVEPGLHEAAHYFTTNTGARLAEVGEADFLFLKGASSLEPLEAAKTGTPSYPETGATLVVQCEGLSHSSSLEALALELEGPGVQHSKEVFILGIPATFINLLTSKNSEYPLGLDVIFSDPFDQIICIPRSNHLTIKNKPLWDM